jgi:hypothetical protein
MSVGSCDDRITLYPAAPLRLATLLHTRTIAREGWGSSSQRQIGEAKSAMVFGSHTSVTGEILVGTDGRTGV